MIIITLSTTPLNIGVASVLRDVRLMYVLVCLVGVCLSIFVSSPTIVIVIPHIFIIYVAARAQANGLM